MSRHPRDTPAGGVVASHPSTHPGAHPAASPATPRPKLSKRPRKRASAPLNALAIAAAQSQRRSPSASPGTSAEPLAEPIATPGTSADAYALLHRPPTEQQAYEFAKLLRSGVPQPDALAYVLGPTDPHTTHAVLALWLRSPALREALAMLNGGAWPTLAPEARLDVALDKHYAEMAYFLYTHDFEQASGAELRKLDTARTALETQRTGRLQANSPFMKFLTAILKPGAEVLRLGKGDGQMPGDNRPVMALGLADVEPAVDGQVVEASDEEA